MFLGSGAVNFNINKIHALKKRANGGGRERIKK